MIVETDEVRGNLYRLSLYGRIPELAAFSVNQLTWEKGERRACKFAELYVSSKIRLVKSEARSSDERFSVEIESSKYDNKLRIKIIPPFEEPDSITANINVHCVFNNGRSAEYDLAVQIQ